LIDVRDDGLTTRLATMADEPTVNVTGMVCEELDPKAETTIDAEYVPVGRVEPFADTVRVAGSAKLDGLTVSQFCPKGREATAE
jgi:hypothetical protein